MKNLTCVQQHKGLESQMAKECFTHIFITFYVPWLIKKQTDNIIIRWQVNIFCGEEGGFLIQMETPNEQQKWK